METLEEKFNKIFDVKLGEVNDKLLLTLVCLNNYYSTRGGDVFVIPKTIKGLKEEALAALIEKSDKERLRKKIKSLFSHIKEKE